MRHRNKQVGASVYILMFLAACVGFVLLSVMKLWTFYMDFYIVKGAIDDLADDPELKKLGSEGVRSTIIKKMNVNMVYSVNRDGLLVEKYDGGVAIDIEYEVREHMFYNIDVILNFEYSVDYELK